MEAEEFSRLLDQSEGETLDFKRSVWDLHSDEGKTAFIKDVLCMANTPRTENSHVVLGVEGRPDGSTHLTGLKEVPDDADLQQQFNERVYPQPRFSFEVLRYKDMVFAVMSIPPDRARVPVVPTKDLPKGGRTMLRRHQVYLRHGSSNSEATRDDLIRIGEWVSGGYGKPSRTRITEDASSWSQFLEAVHGFTPDRRYVLVTTPVPGELHHDLPNLAQAPWLAVVDFDRESDTRGLLRALRETITGHRSLYLRTTQDEIEVSLHGAIYWIFARGLAGRSDLPSTETYREWLSAYQAGLTDKMRRLAAATLPTPVTLVALCLEDEYAPHMRAALEAASGAFSGSLDIVVLAPEPAGFAALAHDLDAPLVAAPLNQICSGLATLGLAGGDQVVAHALPSSSGAPSTLDPADTPWVEEELELLYLDVGLARASANLPGHDFLRGVEPDWYELALHVDVDRDKTASLQDVLVRELDTRTATRVNLYHAPGAGGTTVARRTIWNLHTTHPTALLGSVSNPEEAAARLARVFAATNSPVLVMADGATISERALDELLEQLRSRQLPVVVLQVLRRSEGQREGSRSLYLSSKLTTGEADRFTEVYAREAPWVRRKLEELAASEDPRLRSAFYFGLQTFGKDFRGLTRYVAARLEHLDDIQRELIIYLAMAHHYAQQSLPAQVFAELLSQSPNKPVELEDLLEDSALELLVESSPGEWRTVHELVAFEALQQLLSKRGADRRYWWQHLSSAAIDFARLLRGSTLIPSEDLLEIARRTFIYRDNAELLGTERAGRNRFAQLIEDLRTAQGGRAVLAELPTLYPKEVHFQAHLARLFAFKMKDYDSALEHIEKAIDAQPNDALLNHMRGMILRQQIYDLIGRRTPIEDIVGLAERASDSFARTRELRGDNEHGYISEAQLLIRLIDYGRSGGKSDVVYTAGGSGILDEAFERSEDLLSQVRRLRQGRGDNPYELECRARLDALYGRHDVAVETLLGLLERTDVYKPPLRRQLVWTYLKNRSRAWHKLTRREVERIVPMLEENLEEEPDNERNIRLWIQAIRRLEAPPTLDRSLEQLEYWRSNSGSLEAIYYLYVFNALRAFEGSGLAREDFVSYGEECRRRAFAREDRRRSFEWLGQEEGVRALVHYSELGEWDQHAGFWAQTGPLARVQARVYRYTGPQAGQLLVNGFPAFYVPARVGHTARSINVLVSCYLGFSYDGLRAWEVRDE